MITRSFVAHCCFLARDYVSFDVCKPIARSNAVAIMSNLHEDLQIFTNAVLLALENFSRLREIHNPKLK